MVKPLLPANGALALGLSCHRCTERQRCYRSPQTRTIAVAQEQNWMETSPPAQGPCAEWRKP